MIYKNSFLIFFALFSFFIVSLADAVKLRPVEDKDLKQIHKHLEDPAVTEQMSRIPHPITLEDVTKWHTDAKTRNAQGLLYPFAITPDESDDDVMGVVELKREKSDSSVGELGYWLGKEHWGKGYMSSAVGQATDFAFDKLKLSAVEAFCLENNSGSIKVLEKNGFTRQPGTVSQIMPARAKVGIFVLLRRLRAL